jgi:hypothetical protein
MKANILNKNTYWGLAKPAVRLSRVRKILQYVNLLHELRLSARDLDYIHYCNQGNLNEQEEIKFAAQVRLDSITLFLNSHKSVS